MILQIKGYIVEVDEQNYSLAKERGWCRTGRSLSYFVRSRGGGRREFLHRLIADAKEGQNIDHINGNTLDNRRSNLRIASAIQNGANRGVTKASTSGMKGVYWDKVNKKWMAQMMRSRKSIFLGRFCTKEDAYKAYCTAAQSYDGEFFHE